jgi:predicted RNase H-like HicB family nuclease
MTTYVAIFEQTESGGWSGYVPDLRTILAVEDTFPKAMQKMGEAVHIWTEEMKKQSFPIPPPNTVAVNIEVTTSKVS